MVCFPVYVGGCKLTFVSALHHLHQGGWLHRDISVGNILVVGERGTLIDMEYATKMGQEPELKIVCVHQCIIFMTFTPPDKLAI